MTDKLLSKWCRIVGICLVQLLIAAGVGAQSFDVEPPVIEHDVLESAVADRTQTFSASVADDDQLSGVRFLYRFEGDTEFLGIDMTRVATSSNYTAEVETAVDDGRSIQYYIEARDSSGNRTLRGYNFSPLVRLIDVPALAQVPVVDKGPTGFDRRPIYYVVGGFVVAALVGVLINGQDDDNGRTDMMNPEPGGLVDFTVNVNPPGQ